MASAKFHDAASICGNGIPVVVCALSLANDMGHLIDINLHSGSDSYTRGSEKDHIIDHSY
jgi:hypothetical protein